MNDLQKANHELLLQGAALCGQLPESVYRATHVMAPRGTIGGHFRHCVEHYECLFEAMRTGRLDYATRPRCEATELNPEQGAARFRNLAARFETESMDGAGEIVVRSDHPTCWLGSTVGRELQFLASHTVHHFALMAVLLRLHGQDVPGEFGMAVSTLRHFSSGGSCAR